MQKSLRFTSQLPCGSLRGCRLQALLTLVRGVSCLPLMEQAGSEET